MTTHRHEANSVISSLLTSTTCYMNLDPDIK